jgi:hypothetical protein
MPDARSRGGAPPGEAKGNFTSGYFTKEARDNKAAASEAVKSVRALRRMLADLEA